MGVSSSFPKSLQETLLSTGGGCRKNVVKVTYIPGHCSDLMVVFCTPFLLLSGPLVCYSFHTGQFLPPKQPPFWYQLEVLLLGIWVKIISPDFIQLWSPMDAIKSSWPLVFSSLRRYHTASIWAPLSSPVCDPQCSVTVASLWDCEHRGRHSCVGLQLQSSMSVSNRHWCRQNSKQS